MAVKMVHFLDTIELHVLIVQKNKCPCLRKFAVYTCTASMHTQIMTAARPPRLQRPAGVAPPTVGPTDRLSSPPLTELLPESDAPMEIARLLKSSMPTHISTLRKNSNGSLQDPKTEISVSIFSVTRVS